MATLKPHSNGPLCGNAVIGTLAVDGLAVTFGTARRGLGGLHPVCVVIFPIFMANAGQSKRYHSVNRPINPIWAHYNRTATDRCTWAIR